MILKSQSKFCPFLFFSCFNSFLPHKSKTNDLKSCPNSIFFSTEVIKITSDINSAEMHVDLGYFVLKIFVLKVENA